jgi:hypothetical protein
LWRANDFIPTSIFNAMGTANARRYQARQVAVAPLLMKGFDLAVEIRSGVNRRHGQK